MQLVGAIARFLAAELRLRTLTISLYDTWRIKRDERVRTQYAAIRHATWGLEPEADDQKEMYAVVSPYHPLLETLLETRSRIV